jgi:YebC/PmpR family DNA-binding regulatory protein
MSGHSKWATTKRAKAIVDSKRSNAFTKLANNITIAVRQGGGDAEMNFRLRLAVDRAKSFNMPKENIERAIKKGTGELDGATIEEAVYGALLPGQTAIIIKCLTDNKNRTLNELKIALSKTGAQLTDLNSVAWLFENKGVIKIKKTETLDAGKEEKLEMTIIDSGADNYEVDEEEVTVYTKHEELKAVKDKLESAGLKIDSADLEMIPKEKKEVPDELAEQLSKILETLDELDDVSAYYTNLI